MVISVEMRDYYRQGYVNGWRNAPARITHPNPDIFPSKRGSGMAPDQFIKHKKELRAAFMNGSNSGRIDRMLIPIVTAFEGQLPQPLGVWHLTEVEYQWSPACIGLPHEIEFTAKWVGTSPFPTDYKAQNPELWRLWKAIHNHCQGQWAICRNSFFFNSLEDRTMVALAA